jgi:hypothetical protein
VALPVKGERLQATGSCYEKTEGLKAGLVESGELSVESLGARAGSWITDSDFEHEGREGRRGKSKTEIVDLFGTTDER